MSVYSTVTQSLLILFIMITIGVLNYTGGELWYILAGTMLVDWHNISTVESVRLQKNFKNCILNKFKKKDIAQL